MLAEAKAPPPNLPPEMASFYRKQIEGLYQALQANTEATRLNAVKAIRSLIGEIVLLPEDGELAIEVRGDLAGILTLATREKQNRAAGNSGHRHKAEAEVQQVLLQFEMVARREANIIAPIKNKALILLLTSAHGIMPLVLVQFRLLPCSNHHVITIIEGTSQ